MVAADILHAGSQHPSLWWVVVPALVTFLAGITVGLVASRRSTSTGEIEPSNSS